MPVTSSYYVYVDIQINIQILYWFWFLENIYTILSYENSTRCKLLHKCMVVMKEERSWFPHINTRNRSWDCTALAKHGPSIREILCLTFSIARVIIIPKDGKKTHKGCHEPWKVFRITGLTAARHQDFKQVTSSCCLIMKSYNLSPPFQTIVFGKFQYINENTLSTASNSSFCEPRY